MTGATSAHAHGRARRQHILHLLAEVIRVGSHRQLRQVEIILDRVNGGARVTPTMLGIAEALRQQALEHDADVRALRERPPAGTAWTWTWRSGYLFRDEWQLQELRPGHPITRLLVAEGWRL